MCVSDLSGLRWVTGREWAAWADEADMAASVAARMAASVQQQGKRADSQRGCGAEQEKKQEGKRTGVYAPVGHGRAAAGEDARRETRGSRLLEALRERESPSGCSRRGCRAVGVGSRSVSRSGMARRSSGAGSRLSRATAAGGHEGGDRGRGRGRESTATGKGGRGAARQGRGRRAASCEAEAARPNDETTNDQRRREPTEASAHSDASRGAGRRACVRALRLIYFKLAPSARTPCARQPLTARACAVERGGAEQSQRAATLPSSSSPALREA